MSDHARDTGGGPQRIVQANVRRSHASVHRLAGPVRRLRVVVHGAVQGVGFRPFVYRLATDMGLAGWVINNSQGVFIEVEGPEEDLERFLAQLPDEAPARAIIQTLRASWLDPVGLAGFEIRHSQEQGAKTVLVLPDIATCWQCLEEVLEPANRRNSYPFTNCTNCGPRFTIIQALPYDRPNTTMSRFLMCADCQREYQNPLDRRFHAQPNACPVCGPQLALYMGHISGSAPSPGQEPLETEHRALQATVEALRAGRVVAIKGLGGFHLMVDAGNGSAIDRLRWRKPRRDKPFALMVRDLAQARELCDVSQEAAALLATPEAPIVLLPRKLTAPIADNVAPGNPSLGIMLPYTPLHHLLLQEFQAPLVATSGNLSDEPICTDEREAMSRLNGIADLFLAHNRPIERHADDSVAWFVDGIPQLLRRARGYAPLPVTLSHQVPTILAVGAHLKNTVSLSAGRQVFISQHIGDLETMEAMEAFERVIADFLRLYEARPVAIAHDLHPEYLSTRWAQGAADPTRSQAGAPVPGSLAHCELMPVQHHHAHLAACLAEHGLLAAPSADGGRLALGVTWDGTGYGTDSTIWGGEFLLGDAQRVQRVAHVRTFRLPGGEKAVKEPRRVALALLWELYGDEVLDWEFLAPVRAFAEAERTLIAQMLTKGINAPITSSAGRLFDGIASLVGLHQQTSFEGQAAMALEFAVDLGESSAYPIAVRPHQYGMALPRTGSATPRDAVIPTPEDLPAGIENTRLGAQPHSKLADHPLILDWLPLVEGILDDLRQNLSSGIIAARFHNALVDSIVAVAQRMGQERVALTGGCFQNRILTERAAQRLRAAGFEVLLHRHVPPNDGGISLGQVAVAAARLTNQS